MDLIPGRREGTDAAAEPESTRASRESFDRINYQSSSGTV